MASPIEQALGYTWDKIKLGFTPPEGVKEALTPPEGVKWLFRDQENQPQNNLRGLGPYGQQLLGVAEKKWDQRLAAQREAKQRAVAQIQRQAAIDEKINSNQWLRQQAIRQVNPIYRPQIKGLRGDIRRTVAQGRRTANQVEGYYDAAGAKVAGMQKATRRSSRQAVKNVKNNGVNIGAKGISNAEGKMAAKAVAGMGKAGGSFMKQLRGAIAAEGGVAAADTMRSYQSLADEKRSDLAQLRSQRAAAIAQSAQELKKKYAKAGKKVYRDGFLGSIEAGNTTTEAMQKMNKQLANANPAVRSRVARMIMNNRGNYQNQIANMNELTAEEQQTAIDNRNEEIKTLTAIAEKLDEQGRSDAASVYWQMIDKQLRG